MRIAKAILAASLAAAAILPAAAAWQDEISAFDRQRLARLEQTRALGLAAADSGATDIDRNAVHGVLDAPAGPISAQALMGAWSCRLIKLGGIAPALVYPWFSCRVRNVAGGLYFEKLSGTFRLSGRLDPYGEGRYVLLAAMTVADDEQKPYSGSNPPLGAPVTSTDMLGVLSGIGGGRARIEFPEPVLLESVFDVIELAR